MKRPSVISVFCKTFVSGALRLLHTGQQSLALPHADISEHLIYLRGMDESIPKPYSVVEIERIFSIKYTPVLLFENTFVYRKIQAYCKKFESLREAQWEGAYYKRELDAGSVSPVFIGWTDEIKRWGLFARENLIQGAFIGEYAGRVELVSAFFNNLTAYSYHYPLPLQCMLWFTINPARFGKETRFINHSAKPNCRSVVMFYNGIYRVGICALRAIARGEELTFDYGLTVWGGARTFT